MKSTNQYLKIRQDVVYKVIKNSFNLNKLSHAYLISGARGSKTIETAFFLAKCFLCLEPIEGLACDRCANCLCIDDIGYVDLMYFDKPLTKKNVDDIHRNFSKTAMGLKNVKIYIINQVESATIEALNALLKFLEEPVDNIVGILTTNAYSKVLPTVISRCQVVTLKELGQDELICELEKEGNIIDVVLLAKLCNDLEIAKNIAKSDEYENCKIIVKQILANLSRNNAELMKYVYIEAYKKIEALDCIALFLDMFEVSLLEAYKIQKTNTIPHFFTDELTALANNAKGLDKYILHVMKTKQEILTKAIPELAFDKLFINLTK